MLDEKRVDKIKDWIIHYKMGVIAFLLITLIGATFYLGGVAACKGGVMRNFQCYDPVDAGIVEVCETDPINCATNCKKALVVDVAGFCEQYNKDYRD